MNRECKKAKEKYMEQNCDEIEMNMANGKYKLYPSINATAKLRP